MTTKSITSLSVLELLAEYRSGALQPATAVNALADRIAEVEPKIQAYNHIDLDQSRADAQAVKFDDALPLSGVPIAIKDVLSVKGEPLTCSSKILHGFVSPYDATAIVKLREAGAIFVGRTNMDEFAMGSSTENSSWGVTRNPWDTTRIPGGSSGGSAAAVGGYAAFAALGTDTGGSIRQPAALSGCVGLKPTYGRVSRYGLVAFASSLDQIGTFTRTVEDAALLLGVMAGHDPKDNSSVDVPVPNYRKALEKGTDLTGVRLGVPKEYFIEGIDLEVEAAVKAAIEKYKELGAEIVPVTLPHTKYAVAVYYIIATAEASANLARFDGVRYGHRATGTHGVLEQYEKTRAEGFGAEVKRRIILGTYVLSSGYHEAYYNRAQKVGQLIGRDFQEAFQHCDAIVTPTSPTAAFKIGERTQDPLQMYLADIFTIAVNLAGNCGISIPCGLTSGEKPLPIGLQIIGPKWGEEMMFRVANAFEKATHWHKEKPGI